MTNLDEFDSLEKLKVTYWLKQALALRGHFSLMPIRLLYLAVEKASEPAVRALQAVESGLGEN